ncbi:hypothetical protein BLS_008169 [Venturia inaequalis]|uniref:Nab2-like CCCH zinc finger domain-containing protein n=1 Tax=Venturia inaequalis TaxID=5025 RepID=A0A8H3V2H6_VENIN|nr:hypothetical protein BLS_008169 [Venturia inaequalis]KAE9990756.1 hypothetical protein EG327_000989 [Venturia inaequalis]RDI81370.1 hypothetical protein Vi05172_g8556 [Venturia inaequalis]
MSIEVAVGSQLGEALQTVVLPKLVELGWSTGMQDDTLSEYIILMLANGKTQDQIATELSTDLLDSSPDDAAPMEFAKWLFEQVGQLSAQHNITASTNTGPPGIPEISQGDMVSGGDEEMGNGTDGGEIPTGPKAMRNGPKQGRDKRMLGQLTKNLDRSGDSALHRIRGAGGVGRINSHSREPPKGPRQAHPQNLNRALASGNARPMQAIPGLMGPGMGQMQNGGQFQQQPGMYGAMPPNLQQDTMQQMMQMMEAQAAMLAQMTAAGGAPFQQPQGRYHNHNGRPLADRVEKRGRQNHDRGQQPQNGQSQGGDTAMGEDGEPKEGGAETVNHESKDPKETMCRWNMRCTKPDCAYAHQSPVSLGGLAVDTSMECPHGVACKNTRCTGRHPSPAKKLEFQQKTECQYGPNCARANCPFIHSAAPACKNGADCDAADCQFWHSPIKCKFPSCTNPRCPFKHEPGQKKGPFKNATLILNGGDKQHVSERKFVADEATEELITPSTIVPEAMQEDLQVT